MRKSSTLLLALLIAVLFCASGLACGKSESKPGFIFLPPVDPTNAVFKPNRILEVNVELAPADWDLLRHEGRELVQTFSGCSSEFEYTYFAATATIDGERIENVGVRKKGFLGSLSILRPSIKINFGKIIDGQTWSGMKRLTLNNDLQDPSHTHQVMSYALFREAGTVAPRCNFAHVTVNGVDLGIYSNVESIKKPFLARHFNDNTGNLYEGQLADFTPELVSRFERKTNKTIPDRSDLDRVILALEADNASLLAELEQVLDIDSFLTFWAMEVISGHWDGYDSNRNNFYFYFDPETGLAYPIPWGTDGAFNQGNPFAPGTPTSVFAMSKISYRLYNNPSTRPLYLDKIRSLLDDVWNEGALLAEVDRIEQIVPCDPDAIQMQRDYIMNRRNEILAEISGNGPDWPFPFSSYAPQYTPPIDISGTFSATWGTTNDMVTNGNVSITLGGAPLPVTAIYNAAGPAEEPGVANVVYYCQRSPENDLYIVLKIPMPLVGPGDVQFHGFETVGIIMEIVPPMNPQLLGFIGDGTITFDAAGTNPGDPIQGSFNALMPQ